MLTATSSRDETATVAGGCFWCTEAIFQHLKGVLTVTPGYTGGHVAQPTYAQVSSGTTGHAEAIQISFDPTIIPYEKLLEIFLAMHNPTTPNRQGADVGSQYRSVIFYHNAAQATTARAVIAKLEEAGTYDKPIVTEVVPYTTFYPAEDYHRNFYEKNRGSGYCQVVIDPKLAKLTRQFSNDVVT